MLGHIAIGLAVVAGVAPASFAGDSRVQDRDKSAATGIEVETPIGRVWVDPEFVDGEPTYVRRTTAKEGMAIVEVSATPFMPDVPGGAQSIGRPEEQPAPW